MKRRVRDPATAVGRDVFVLVARKMTPRFFETAAAERADCRFYLAKNGDLFVVKVPSWEHGDLVGELLEQSGNYLDSLVPPALQDLACAGDAANMATGVGTVREPDIRVTPRGAPPPPPFTKLPRVIIDLEWKHRSPRVIREYGHELLSTHADVRAFVSIYAHRNPTGSVVAAAAMWQKTPAGGIVLSDAVSFGTVDLSAKTKAHFAAAAFGRGGAVLLPPVPNLAAAGVVTWRTALHLPVPAPAAEFCIPATQVLYNIQDPATGVAAVIPAALPDLVLNFRAMLRKIL